MHDKFPGANPDLFRASLKTIGLERLSGALTRVKNGSGDFPKPISVHLNLTLRCTARCRHCKQWTWPAHAEFTRDQLHRIFDVFNEWGVESVTFGGGNPLLLGEIEYALQAAKQHGLSIGIITEGIPLSDSLAGAICTNASWIRFSLDGPSPKIHDYIRNTPGLFDLVVSNIAQLKSVNPNLPIGLNCVVQKQNYQHLSQMIELAQRLGLDVLLFKLPHGDDPGKKYLLSEEAFEVFKSWVAEENSKQHHVRTNLSQIHALLQNAFDKMDIVSGKPVRTFYTSQGIHCFVPLFFVVCDSEGNIYPCDYLQADTRLWDGQYGQIRDSFKAGNILLEDSDTVLAQLRHMYREKIFDLPSKGYPECGCCTRFFQVNAALSTIALQDSEPNLDLFFDAENADDEMTSPFL